MRISARTRYATRILLDLAEHARQRPSPVSEMAQRTGITPQFIEQIMKNLRRCGLVVSRRGVAGGYVLAASPDAITLGAVVRCTEEMGDLAPCLDVSARCHRAQGCRTRQAWQQVARSIMAQLDAISLQDLLQGEVQQCPGAQGPPDDDDADIHPEVMAKGRCVDGNAGREG